MFKGSIQEEDITIINIYKPNIEAPQYVRLLLLLLSHFSRVRLCVTAEMAAHQASPSLGFSKEEHWSGLPFPSPVHEKIKVKVKLLSRVRLLATPRTAAYQAPLSMGFSRQEYWSGVPLPSPDNAITISNYEQDLAYPIKMVSNTDNSIYT